MKNARRPKQRKGRAAPPLRLIVSIYVVTFAVALGVRLLYLWSIHDAPFFSHLQTNALRYHQWALLILDGPQAPSPPFDQPPGYAYWVALIYAVFGRAMLAVTTVQALVDAGTCVLIAHLARVFFGNGAAATAGLLAAVCAPLIYFSGELLPATVALAAATMTVVLVVQARWRSAGCLTAVAMLFRSELLLSVPLLALYGGLRARRAALQRYVAPVAVVLALVVAVNARMSGHFVPLTLGGGVNLWLGNNAHADGVNPFLVASLATQAQEIRAQAPGDDVEADRLFGRRALAFWAGEPSSALALLLKKLVWTWTRRELPNTSDIDWQTAHSWLFRHGFFPIGFGFLVPTAFAGLILARRRWREIFPLLVPLVVGVATCLVFFTNARFRLIILPALIVLAAHWISELPRLRYGRFDKLSWVGFGLGCVLAWGNFYDVRNYEIPQIVANTGILERETGRLPNAAEHLRRAVTLEPADAIAWGHLALALEQMGLVDDAFGAYLEGLSHNPNSPDLRGLARRSFARNHVPESLLDAYLAANATSKGALADQIHAALAAARGRSN